MYILVFLFFLSLWCLWSSRFSDLTGFHVMDDELEFMQILAYSYHVLNKIQTKEILTKHGCHTHISGCRLLLMTRFQLRLNRSELFQTVRPTNLYQIKEEKYTRKNPSKIRNHFSSIKVRVHINNNIHTIIKECASLGISYYLYMGE